MFPHELQRAHRVIKDVNLTVAGHGLEHRLLKIKVVVRSNRIHQTPTMVPRDGPWITYPFTAVTRHTHSFFFTARVRWFGVVLIPRARVFARASRLVVPKVILPKAPKPSARVEIFVILRNQRSTKITLKHILSHSRAEAHTMNASSPERVRDLRVRAREHIRPRRNDEDDHRDGDEENSERSPSQRAPHSSTPRDRARDTLRTPPRSVPPVVRGPTSKDVHRPTSDVSSSSFVHRRARTSRRRCVDGGRGRRTHRRTNERTTSVDRGSRARLLRLENPRLCARQSTVEFQGARHREPYGIFDASSRNVYTP